MKKYKTSGKSFNQVNQGSDISSCMRRNDKCQVLPAVSVLFFSHLNDSTTHQLNIFERRRGNYKLGGIGFFG